MKKKTTFSVMMLAATVLGCGVCSAAVIPAEGPGQIGYSSVVLCDGLTLHDAPTADSAVTEILKSNDRIIVMDVENNWAQVVLGDSEDSLSGWVDISYLAVDPAWYLTEEDTPIYAWDDTSAPKVAVVEDETYLPILKDNGDWLIVSVKGASGWVNVPNRNDSVSMDTGKSDTTKPNNAGSTSVSSQQAADQGTWFTVISRDGDTVSIHHAGGAMYEDADGRTYVKQDEDAFYYCIATDITYALDATMWTGEAFGENEFPDWTGEDFGENEFPDDYDDDYDYTGEDYGENEFPDDVDDYAADDYAEDFD